MKYQNIRKAIEATWIKGKMIKNQLRWNEQVWQISEEVSIRRGISIYVHVHDYTTTKGRP